MPLMDNDAVYMIVDGWCRLVLRRPWFDRRCRRCGEARYNHARGRLRDCVRGVQ